MPAPIGNEYYKLRSKSGVSKLFESGEQILQLAKEYIQHCENNPIKINEMVRGGDNAGEVVVVERPRIPTQIGFTVFIGITKQTLSNYKTKPSYKDFFDSFHYVCEVFENILTDNSLTGQANAMIASRMLGLKERQDITTDDKEITSVSINVADPNKPE